MKNIIILFIFCAAILLLPSCEDMMGDYLEKAPGVDVTEDTIFTNKVQVETFIASMYRFGLHSNMPRYETTNTGGVKYNTLAVACDEAYAGATWVDGTAWNNASVTIDNINTKEDYRFFIRFKAIRMANILLKRIEEVPELDPAFVTQVKGEARFMRALNYFEMLKRYGGVPIVDKKFELTDNFNIPRSTLKETVDFIVSDCDAAASALPDAYPTNMRGRSTKGAALILKSRTLLYAASPIFNTGTPFLDMADKAKNNLICYGNTDPARWQLAADAAKAVIDWAPNGGIALITNQGVDKNYRYMSDKPDNSEIILANKMLGSRAIWEWPWTGILPIGTYSGTWGMGNTMTFNFVTKYEKKDGTPQTWNMGGGTDLTQKYNELDLRFKQTVTVVGDRWNNDFPMINSYVGGNHNTNNFGGQWIFKSIPQSLTNSANRAMPNDKIFRLGEAYLNYAEALNEAKGPVAEAYAAVNIIRARSGQPDLPAGLTQDQFRQRVRNERAIELFDEDHRFWDIRRWLIAEEDGVMKGNFYGLKAYLNPAAPNFRYEVYTYQIRSFNKQMYLHPFLRNEVLKGYLVQNPGW